MKKINLKFKKHVRNVSIMNNDIERITLNIIFLSFGALAFLYVLFLGNMVKDIVERRSLEASARGLSGDVGDLELAYLSLSNDVDLNLSYSMGFKETKATFATRKSLSSISAGDLGASKPLGNIKTLQNGL